MSCQRCSVQRLAQAICDDPVSASSWEAYVEQSTNGTNAKIARMNANIVSRIGATPSAIPAISPTRYVVPTKPRVLPYLNFGDSQRHMHEFGGVVWVPVHVSDPPRLQFWDLIDLSTGQRLDTVKLPMNQRLMNVSARGAYVIATDEDDVQRLLLYRRQ